MYTCYSTIALAQILANVPLVNCYYLGEITTIADSTKEDADCSFGIMGFDKNQMEMSSSREGCLIIPNCALDFDFCPYA